MCKLLEALNKIAHQFFELHDITCYTRRFVKHSHFQCKHNSDPIIAFYREDNFSCPDIEQVVKYCTYVGAHEINSLINKFLAISHVAHVMKGQILIILQLCKKNLVIMFMLKKELLLPWKVLILCRMRRTKT